MEGAEGMTNEEKVLAVNVQQLRATVSDQAATIARLERELAEAKPKAEALDALTAWIDSGAIMARQIKISESPTRDRPFYRVTVAIKRQRWDAEHSDLAAAIMDAVRKAQ